MARSLSEMLDLPCLELDGVYHQPDWTLLPEDEFRSKVDEFTNRNRWVVDGNYNSAGVLDLVWNKADTVVWVDPPRRVVMSRVVRRTIRRAATREELWNGNREPWSNFTRWDPRENIIRWTWTRFASTWSRYEQRMADPRWEHLTFIRLRSRKDAKTFLEELA